MTAASQATSGTVKNVNFARMKNVSALVTMDVIIALLNMVWLSLLMKREIPRSNVSHATVLLSTLSFLLNSHNNAVPFQDKKLMEFNGLLLELLNALTPLSILSIPN